MEKMKELEKSRNIIVFASEDQNSNVLVKLRLQFLEDRFVIMAEADKCEKGEEEALDFIEGLYKQLEKDGIAHEAFARNCENGDRIDHLSIPLVK